MAGTTLPPSPTSTLDERPATAWSPLRYPNYRSLWMASVVSHVGTWMQNVGAAWLMTTLSHSSPFYVGLVQTATNLPVFLLGIPSGAMADIVDRRKLLIVTQSWMLAAAATLGVLTTLGLTGPYTLLLLTFALGIGSSMNDPAWQAIVPELVPRKELASAIALNSVGFNLARAAGPALGGAVVAAVGVGMAFNLNAVSFIGVVTVLVLWKRTAEHEPAAEGVGAAIWAGIRYVRFDPVMRAVLVRCGTFVFPATAIWAILPVVAREELHSESTGYGLLLGCLGVGSIIGALLLSRMRRSVRFEYIVTTGVLLFGAANIGLWLLGSFIAVCGTLVAAGVAWMFVNSTLNTAAQTALPGWVRARALALYLLTFQGSMAIAGVVWGTVASHFGLRFMFLIAGLTLFTSAVVTFRMRLDTGEVDRTPSPHWAEPALERLVDPEHGPVLVTVEYTIDPTRATDFTRAMKRMEIVRRRDGALRWGLFADASRAGCFIETFVVANWAEHVRQHERFTVTDREIQSAAWSFHTGGETPVVRHWLAARE